MVVPMQMAHGRTPPPLNSRLYQAATIGDVDLFKHALGELPDVNDLIHVESPQGNSVLHVAASFGHDMMIQLIVKKCPPLVTKRNKNGDTALHGAARVGHLSGVKLLVDYAKKVRGDLETGNSEEAGEGGLIKMTNVDGNTALHEALKCGHHMVAKALTKADKKLLDVVNNNGESSFYLAAQGGLQELVAELLTCQIDHLIREKKEGKTALHAAIHTWHIGIIKLLLKEKPELVKLRDARGRSPFHYVIDTGSSSAVCWFLKSDASMAYHQDCDGTFPIHKAASKGNIKIIQEILHHCPDSRELRDAKGRNALHVAVDRERGKMVDYIMKTPELEKLINEDDLEGNTPLHVAILKLHGLIVSDLVRDQRVDLSAVNKKGFTPRDICYRQFLSTEPSLGMTLIGHAMWLAKAPFSLNGLHEEDLTDLENKRKRIVMDSMKSKLSTLLIVATIIGTITFAAGFTMPGGYNNDGPDKGMATMLRKIKFHIFVISNTIAMYSSSIAAITIVWAQIDNPRLWRVMSLSVGLLAMALAMMTVAFGAGVNLVVSKLQWLAVVVQFLSFMSLLCISPIFLLYLTNFVPKYHWVSVLVLHLLRLSARL